MPNWCSNHIFFYGDPKDVKRLYNKINTTSTIKDMVRQEITPGFDDENWLGTLALAMGFNVCGYRLVQNSIVKSNDGKDTDYPCRGAITSNVEVDFEFDDEEASLNFYYDSAWAPCNELMIAIAEMFNLDISQLSEEPGCELYSLLDSRYDRSFFEYENYIIDSERTGIEYVVSESAAIKLLSEAYDEKSDCPNGIYGLIKIINKKHEDGWCGFYEFDREYVELNKKEFDTFFGDM